MTDKSTSVPPVRDVEHLSRLSEAAVAADVAWPGTPDGPTAFVARTCV